MSQDNTVNNKRIAKNTLLLYIRMAITMAVSLYTSRVVLNTLGVDDYGIFNVVGGIITLFTFINGGMLSATQRYLTFEIGKNNREKLELVFNTSIQIHSTIAILIIILGETIGYWFLINKMNIPPERMEAAIYVFHCSIAACAINIITVPFNADIIANEKMDAFAYISIVETILKLLIVYLLVILDYDKLIIYAFLLLFVQILVSISYVIYCKLSFNEIKIKRRVDKNLFVEMSKFAGWSFFGNMASILYSQGLNILLNLFFGPAVNAARAIAVQVQSATSQFVANFQMALNPQITKNYAIGDFEHMHALMHRCARFSFYLMYLIALPVLLETDYILLLWLKQVPDNTVIFLRIMIVTSLLYTVVNPLVVANQATGDIKLYQIVVGSLLLLILPISYLALLLGAPAYSVFIVHLAMEGIAQVARIIMLKNKIKMPASDYFKEAYLPITRVCTMAFFAPLCIHYFMSEGLARLLLVGLVSTLSILIMITLWGLKSSERDYIENKIRLLYVKFCKSNKE